MEKSNVENVAEEIIEYNNRLMEKISEQDCHIKDLKDYIECLKADLAEEQDNKMQLPTEPIKVAEMLIDAQGTYETNIIQRKFGAKEIETYTMYSKSDLRQIAEHLLVYCNNSEE